MSKPAQNGAILRPHSLRTRWLALACVLLATVMGTVQAVHVHGDLLPDHAVQLHAPAEPGQSLGGEEHCPLCVALHSALPSSPQTLLGSVVLSSLQAAESTSEASEKHWHYAMFSRPPPVRR